MLLVAGALVLVARPLAVFVALAPTRLGMRARAMVSWVGLRGAVPIVLATFPLAAGVDEAETIFDAVFFIVLTSVLVQGTTIPLTARWLSVDAPLPARPSYPLEAVFSDADTSLHELTIPADSPVAGRQLVEIGLPAGALVVLLSRNGEFVVPQGGTVLSGGDNALVLADAETLPRVRTVSMGPAHKVSRRADTDQSMRGLLAVSFRRRRANFAVLVTLVFVFAWVLRLWLLVLGCVAAAVALMRLHRRYWRTVLPAFIAGTAATRAPGVAASIAVEEWAAMWLAVTSGGRAERLRRAARLVARTEADPWAARVAIMRLEAAEQALTQGRVLGLSSRGRIAPGCRAGVWGALAVAFLALAHTGGIWWLAPTAWALASMSGALTEFQESRTAPRLLASEALVAPSRWGDSAASRLELALLAGGDARVLRQSRQLVEAATWDIPNRHAAVRELAAAEAMVRTARPANHNPSTGEPPWIAVAVGGPGGEERMESHLVEGIAALGLPKGLPAVFLGHGSGERNDQHDSAEDDAEPDPSNDHTDNGEDDSRQAQHHSGARGRRRLPRSSALGAFDPAAVPAAGRVHLDHFAHVTAEKGPTQRGVR